MSQPKRVDPAAQRYERLPERVLGLEGGRYISFPLKIDMHDSARFSADGVEYRLKELKPVAVDRLCKSADGARWPCGRQAAVFVGNMIRGQTLVCKVMRNQAQVDLSGCRTAKMLLSFEAVASGSAFPGESEGEFDVALMQAKAGRVGVWKDINCDLSRQSC